MAIVPDWNALRRPLRSCAIGALVLLAFFAVWQFLVPGEDSNPIAALALILVTSCCLALGVGLAVSATRRLWRSTQRGMSVLPAMFLIGVTIALPSAARAAGAHWLIGLGAALLALLSSAACSAYLLIMSRPSAPKPSPEPETIVDEAEVYVSDISGKRNTG